MKVQRQRVRLLCYTPDPERNIELAGRTCYKSESGIGEFSAMAFIHMLVSKGHEAVLEHSAASFQIITDRGVSHEIVRHRLASYSQESTRYCNYSKGRFNSEITVIEPPDLSDKNKQYWKDACKAAEEAYLDMLNSGAPPQIARSVLPTCLKTELIMTANFREWRHFVKLRSDKAAHPQIKEIARLLLIELCQIAPSVFDDILQKGA